jgi:hypothetical protein
MRNTTTRPGIREATARLNDPPTGGIVRQQKDSPWEALGISRGTWYRHGKPTERPIPRGQGPFSQRNIAARDRISLRTQQRRDRIMEFDFDLWRMTVDGKIKATTAEQIITDPVEYQRFLEWYTRGLDLTEYVLWTVNRQLDELENRYPKRRAPLGIRKLGEGETVIYLPASAPIMSMVKKYTPQPQR